MIYRLIMFGCLAISINAFALDQSRDALVRQWRALMNYETKNGAYESSVLNPAFFLSPNGAKDADQELQKTLQVFSEVQSPSDHHPQCLYPARYDILRKTFLLAPPVPCPNFDSWRRSYGITNINVLYGSQYISTPTSAFGHAFFLIDSDTTSEYLRATYNYGADIPADVGARLVIDGLGGGFRGNYSVIPLYHRLHSYNDIENRDIWEYTLALTPAERDLVVKYLWEVQDKFSAPYYFLTGNCASSILETLNIVRPGLNLKTSSPIFTSPQEIFRVLDQHGLIASVKYRPSLEKQLDRKLNSLSKNQLQEFKQILSSKKELPKDALLAETVLTFVQFQRVKNQGATPEPLKSIERKALLARAEIADAPPFDFPRAEWPARPHEAQGPQLIGVGRSDGSPGAATTFVLRPAFHDLMQTDAGFLNNSSIDVLSIEGRIPDGREPTIEALTLARVINFRETKVYDPMATSWMIEAKVLRNPFLENGLRYHLVVSPEIGFATQLLTPSLLLFGLAGMDVREGDAEPFGKFDAGSRIGIVGTLGRIKTFLSYRVTWQSADAQSWQKREAEIKVRYNLNQAWDLLAEFQQAESAGSEDLFRDLDLSLRYSF